MNYSISILMILLFSCSIIQDNSKKNILNQNNWIEHRAVYPDAGFVLEFKYPNNITVARSIDNCLCVGVNTKHYDENEASFEDNTRQWCICVDDTANFSVNNLISSWRTTFTGEVVEKRDTVAIGNLKALRITLKNKKPSGSYSQLIYLQKYSTLFEIMNVDESTSKDFEMFCESIKIAKYRKP